MKPIFFIFTILCATAAGADPITPITIFEEGNYVGSGSWLADDGTSGNFLTFLRLDCDGWTKAQFRSGELKVYETFLNIDGNGFFSALVVDASDPLNPILYEGHGNCGNTICQITVDLGVGTLNNVMHFDRENKTVYTFGAIRFSDGVTPDVQWEELVIGVRE